MNLHQIRGDNDPINLGITRLTEVVTSRSIALSPIRRQEASERLVEMALIIGDYMERRQHTDIPRLVKELNKRDPD